MSHGPQAGEARSYGTHYYPGSGAHRRRSPCEFKRDPDAEVPEGKPYVTAALGRGYV